MTQAIWSKLNARAGWNAHLGDDGVVELVPVAVVRVEGVGGVVAATSSPVVANDTDQVVRRFLEWEGAKSSQAAAENLTLSRFYLHVPS